MQTSTSAQFGSVMHTLRRHKNPGAAATRMRTRLLELGGTGLLTAALVLALAFNLTADYRVHTYLRHLQDEYLDLGATYAEQAHADPTHAERRDALAASIEALDPEVRVLYCDVPSVARTVGSLENMVNHMRALTDTADACLGIFCVSLVLVLVTAWSKANSLAREAALTRAANARDADTGDQGERAQREMMGIYRQSAMANVVTFVFASIVHLCQDMPQTIVAIYALNFKHSPLDGFACARSLQTYMDATAGGAAAPPIALLKLAIHRESTILACLTEDVVIGRAVLASTVSAAMTVVFIAWKLVVHTFRLDGSKVNVLWRMLLFTCAIPMYVGMLVCPACGVFYVEILPNFKWSKGLAGEAALAFLIIGLFAWALVIVRIAKWATKKKRTCGEIGGRVKRILQEFLALPKTGRKDASETIAFQRALIAIGPTAATEQLLTKDPSVRAASVRRAARTVHERYEFQEKLGEGAYGVVFKAKSADNDGGEAGTGGLVAIKCCKKESMNREDRLALYVEVQCLKKCAHGNVMKMHEFVEEGVSATKGTFYIVTELLLGGELYDRIIEKKRYPEGEAAALALGLMRGLEYMHEASVVHRDLKPENIILVSRNDDVDAKIIDLGFAKEAQVGARTMTTVCGTPDYLAPEIISNKKYSGQCDLWSFGVMLYVVLAGYPPFHADNQATLFAYIREGSFHYHSPQWDGISDAAKKVIRSLIEVAPEKRLTAKQAVSNPWFDKVRDKRGKSLAGRTML